MSSNITMTKQARPDLWYTEQWTDNCRFSFSVKKTLYSARTRYQQLDILETPEFGNVMLLDGLVMVTQRDHFIYHEMIAHPPVNTHPHPENVLVIGGGDGGTVTEFVKYDFLKKIDLVEIDGDVIDQSRVFFPEVSKGYDDPRVTAHTEDGVKFVTDAAGQYDIVIIDSTDPIGPAQGLFTTEFYRAAAQCLRPNGILVAQGESAYFFPDVVSAMVKNIRSAFTYTDLYSAFIPTYPSGFWHFVMASKDVKARDGFAANRKNIDTISRRYYNHDIHTGAFALPEYVRELLE